MTPTLRIEKLRRDTPVEGFDCGKEALNRFLIRYAWQNQQAGAAQTYIAIDGERVVKSSSRDRVEEVCLAIKLGIIPRCRLDRAAIWPSTGVQV